MPLTSLAHPRYKPGQRWIYQAPPGQENSRLVILHLEEMPGIGPVVHISVEGLRLPAPKLKGGIATHILHLPMLLESLEQDLIAEDTKAFGEIQFPNDGYEIWEANQGGPWIQPMARLVEMYAGFYSPGFED